VNSFTKLLKEAIKEKESATLYKLISLSDEGGVGFFAKNESGDVVLLKLNLDQGFQGEIFDKIYKKSDLIKKYPILAYAKQVEGEHSHFEQIESAETYNGKKRSDLKDEDFLDPKNRSFPVVNCKNVKAAISTWGLYKGEMSFETFKKRLIKKAKKIKCESSLPKSWSK